MSVLGRVVPEWDIVTARQLPWCSSSRGRLTSRFCSSVVVLVWAKPPSWQFLHVTWYMYPQIRSGEDYFSKKGLFSSVSPSLSPLQRFIRTVSVSPSIQCHTCPKGWAPGYNYPHLRSSAPEAASVSKHRWNVPSEQFSFDLKALHLRFLLVIFFITQEVFQLFRNSEFQFYFQDLNRECNAMQVIPSWKY